MTYVDGYVLPVPKKNLKKYKKMASDAGKIWMKHGALGYYECVGDDLHPDMGGVKLVQFPKMAKAKPNETVFYSFIMYKSKTHRNHVNKKVGKEMEKDPKNKDMRIPFDMKRMAFGGFKSLVEFKRK